MDMALIGDVANIFAALGIILTLGFLAFEQHKNTQQAKIDTWNRVMQGLRETRRRTDSPHVADVIARGRIDYFSLSQQLIGLPLVSFTKSCYWTTILIWCMQISLL